jgi:sugar fermentation stimulation protein A
MKFSQPLIRGTLIKRYKRFLADVRLDDGDLITAHCANPGSMMGLSRPGLAVWVSPSANPARKLKYSLELVELDISTPVAYIGINTQAPNKIALEAITNGRIAELDGYQTVRREVRYASNSRIDILLENPDGTRCFVEVKNVHLFRRPGLAEFPDSITARGSKHLRDLSDVVDAKTRAVMLYIVQGSAQRFALAEDIDPTYARCFTEARASGVEALCYFCDVTPQRIELVGRVDIVSPKPIAPAESA